MNELLRSILKEQLKFTDEDFEIKNALKAMMETPGWKFLTEKIWPDQFKFLRKQGYARNRSAESAKQILGIMEGHEITIDIVKDFVALAEREEVMRMEMENMRPPAVGRVDNLNGGNINADAY